MGAAENKPRVTVSKAGVRQVSPSDILRSRAGREQIRQTQGIAQRTAKDSKGIRKGA